MDQATLYKDAYFDAAVVNSLVEKLDEPFWQQAYTSVIRWIRIAAELAGTEEPDLRRIAALAADDGKLKKLVEKAFEKCGDHTVGLPGVKRPAVGPRNEERELREHTARNLRRWHSQEWSSLHPKLRRSITEGLHLAAHSDVVVYPRNGTVNGEGVPIGERRGPWKDWNQETLRLRIAGSMQKATAKLRGETKEMLERARARAQPAETGGPNGPAATQGNDAGGEWNSTKLQRTVRNIEGLVRKTRAVNSELQNGIQPPRDSGRTESIEANRLIETAQRTAVDLLDGAIEMAARLRVISSKEEKEWRERSGKLAQQNPTTDEPLRGRQTCFTGKLTLPRHEAILMALRAGAHCQASLSWKTTLLVKGTTEPQNQMQANAAKRQAGGQKIEIIDEVEFRRRATAQETEPAEPTR